MNIKTGRTWVDLGPAAGRVSSVTGGRWDLLGVALSDAKSPGGMAAAATPQKCGICGDATSGGRMYCSVEHSKLGWGDRRPGES